MNIELATPTQLKITWPVYGDSSIEAEIVKRLATVPGIEGRGRRWYAPAIQLARLMELFPKASFDYAALVAAGRLGLVFYESLVCLHLNVIFDESGAIVGLGENVSPLIQQLIDERAHAIKPFVLEAAQRPRRQQAAKDPLHGPLTAEDAGWDRVMTGARNAAKREEERQQFKFQKRRRKKKVEAT